MSIDDGWNATDKAAEEDYERGIAMADEAGQLAEKMEKDLLQGKPVICDGVEWAAAEVFDECGICGSNAFSAIVSGDSEKIDGLREKIRDFLQELAEEHLENQEQDGE